MTINSIQQMAETYRDEPVEPQLPESDPLYENLLGHMIDGRKLSYDPKRTAATVLPPAIKAKLESMIPQDSSMVLILLDGKVLRSTSKYKEESFELLDSIAESTTENPSYIEYFINTNSSNTIKVNLALNSNVFVVHVVEDLIQVVNRVRYMVPERASVQITELFLSETEFDSALLTSSVVELGESSTVKHLTIQDLADNCSVAISRKTIQKTNSNLESLVAALGGKYSHIRTQSSQIGSDSFAKLKAVYVGTDNQIFDFRTVQYHVAPRTKSDLLFKGIVAGNAHSMYDGLIKIEKGASGTEAFQTNRNLVLTEGAKADSVPNLEIEENDVKCSHASAIGPVDETQLFYLGSKGVAPDVAQSLIIKGFLRDLIFDAGDDKLIGHVDDRLGERISHAIKR